MHTWAVGTSGADRLQLGPAYAGDEYAVVLYRDVQPYETNAGVGFPLALAVAVETARVNSTDRVRGDIGVRDPAAAHYHGEVFDLPAEVARFAVSDAATAEFCYAIVLAAIRALRGPVA